MKVRAGSGWQTVLADLSLILFMITATAVSQGSGKPTASARAPEPKPAPPTPLEGEPVALYRPGFGAPPLAEWIRAERGDARQRLTIVVPFAPGGQATAIAIAARMAQEAGVPSRIIVEPGDPADAYAALTYDIGGGPQMARGLHSGGKRP